MVRHLEDVYCTLLMSDSYLTGAAVLAHSLRDAGTKKKLAVLVTLDTLSADTISTLRGLYDYLIPVERIRNPNPSNLYVMGRPDLAFAFTKIALWRQTQFRKIVYLDADVVALRALDELFDIEASFAAAPDIGWPDCFNSGVMVLSPDMGEYWALQTMAATGDSFDGADQGLLNQYFEHRPWQRLKFTYNCTPNAEYQWEPAYRHFKRDISAVHFIGKNKPWFGERSAGAGVYGELLARWWAVYDRNLRQPKPVSHLASSDIGIEPEASINTTEAPLTEPGEAAENIDQGLVEPTPTVQQRKFSAPEMQWDATRSEPPTQSRPEAANFPTQTYTFSDSHALFQAPQAYPEPPKDMWYKVPESQPKPTQKLAPIFPWEQQPDRPKATRVFAEDLPAKTASPSEVSSPTHAFSTVHYQDELEAAPTDAESGSAESEGISSPKTPAEQWEAFQSSNVNVWDNDRGIEKYIRGIMEPQGRKGKTQTLLQTEGASSPLLERRDRRESLILTDFPSAVERPSLPVTPAPVRRPTFWGGERDEAGELPAAEGVPDQPLWNPNEQLEQLRRSSLVEFEHLKKDEHPNPPLRALPEHSVFEEKVANPAPASVVIEETSDSIKGTGEKSSTSTVLSDSSLTQHIGRVSKGASTDDQLKGQQTAIREIVGDSPPEQPPAPLTQTPEAHGIVGKDFATAFQTEYKSLGPFTGEGLFTDTSTQESSTEAWSGFSTTTSHTSFAQQQSSSSQHQSLSSQHQSSSSQHQSSTQHQSSSVQPWSFTQHQSSSVQPWSSIQEHSPPTKETIQAGKTTFNLPDFAADSWSESEATGEDILSPTHGEDESDTKGQGLF